MILLPIRTNIGARRTPYANYAFIAINVLVFLLSFSYGRSYRYVITGAGFNTGISLPIRPWAADWLLVPAVWHYWQFITYAFLHGGFVHIVGNMFFLYLFGNAINDKLGNFRYSLFYLAGAVFSGIGHVAVNSASYSPILGASGAVAAVTGAYLVLFPQTLITVLYWFFFIGTIEIPALYFMIARLTPGVAYDAHLAGYAYGVGVTVFLLGTRLVSSSHFDLWSMFKLWNRRRNYRDVVAAGCDPFTGVRPRKPVQAREVRRPQVPPQRQARINQIRHEITHWLAERTLPPAADLYLELMQLDPEQLLPRQDLLDIANQLASDHRTAEAARAYEQFLLHYGHSEYAEQVELMLGILYSRYLNDPRQAIKHLQNAVDELTDPSQLQMCRDELAKLGA
jgi:membrane associated rhomboid family serine protease